MGAASITREGVKAAFQYRRPDGRLVRDAATLARIKQLVIPPAWTDVHIAVDANAPLQATGFDVKGRKQYRYHPSRIAERDRAKFAHLLDFARALPSVRRRVARDLTAPPLSRERVLATVVALLEQTHIRIGNDEYTRANGSYGLTTLRNEHVNVRGSRVEFQFTGKSGVDHTIALADPRLADEIRQCKRLPEETVFDYRAPSGRIRHVRPADVNRYLAGVTGTRITAKDFRTWWGTVSAAVRLRRAGQASSVTKAKRVVCQVLDGVAAELGNTRTVCRKSYVHPAVIDAFLEGEVITAPEARLPRMAGLRRDERMVLAWLQQRASKRPAKMTSRNAHKAA